MTTYLLRQLGQLPNGDEWVATTHFSSTLDLAAAAAVAVTYVTHLWNGNGTDIDGVGSYFSGDTFVAESVLDQLDPATGHLVARSSLGVTPSGTSDDQALPGNDTVFVGLRTASFARSGRGGFHLPAPGVSVMVGGAYSTVFCDDIATVVAACLSEASEDELVPVIYHPGSRTTTNVTLVRVGSVPGELESRKNKAIPAYQTSAVS